MGAFFRGWICIVGSLPRIKEVSIIAVDVVVLMGDSKSCEG